MADHSVPPLSREDTLECAVCLQPCLQPVEFPCSHVFCFLCAKGIAMQNGTCALCRSVIPPDFVSNPNQFTKQARLIPQVSASPLRYVWYYQGYNGWWQYDERTCGEIETAYNNNLKTIDVLVAGSVYVIDLENQIQYQRHRNSRKRKIKRDLESANKKGVAGLEVNNTIALQPSGVSGAVAVSSGGQQSTEAAVCSGGTSRIEMVVETTGNDSNRDVPIGSEEQMDNAMPATSNVAHGVLQSPVVLLRSTSDTTGMSQTARTPGLCRYNTYAPGESPME